VLGVAVFQAKKERDAGLATRSWRQLSGKITKTGQNLVNQDFKRKRLITKEFGRFLSA
jgi:hypothetical protein